MSSISSVTTAQVFAIAVPAMLVLYAARGGLHALRYPANSRASFKQVTVTNRN